MNSKIISFGTIHNIYILITPCIVTYTSITFKSTYENLLDSIKKKLNGCYFAWSACYMLPVTKLERRYGWTRIVSVEKKTESDYLLIA